ncbi:hypothetical protein [Salinibacter altiplanensis]|uniref:hypothetical protein n=1 Tax=Salinibacter altiplanensis TaxID=1803181 RepID=UPI000C9F219C|nr:hypothetical protein [Salinibacter altiplanensis]
MSDTSNDESEDPTQDLREETREMLSGLSFGQTEALATIVNYLPTIAAKLEGVRQELTLISSILQEEFETPDEELTAENHEEIEKIMGQSQDEQLHKIISILQSIGEGTDEPDQQNR